MSVSPPLQRLCHPHRRGDEASCPQRGGTHDVVLNLASGRHPTGTPVRPLAGRVRPERSGSHRVRRPGRGRRGGAGRHPGEDVGGAGHCGPQGQPRWTPLRRGRRQASHSPCPALQGRERHRHRQGPGDLPGHPCTGTSERAPETGAQGHGQAPSPGRGKPAGAPGSVRHVRGQRGILRLPHPSGVHRRADRASSRTDAGDLRV